MTLPMRNSPLCGKIFWFVKKLQFSRIPTLVYLYDSNYQKILDNFLEILSCQGSLPFSPNASHFGTALNSADQSIDFYNNWSIKFSVRDAKLLYDEMK